MQKLFYLKTCNIDRFSNIRDDIDWYFNLSHSIEV